MKNISDDNGSLWDQKSAFSFIDLFAGIGGFRIALESLKGQCVFTSERDKYCRETYKLWFGEYPQNEDINDLSPLDIPDHDVLTAGFPCQPFSIAGVSKKSSLGMPHGFQCEKQGNLFFKICDIVDAKRPPILLLENVKNLKSHNKGITWKVIEAELSGRGYSVFHQVINAKYWVPQHRERIFISCFDKKVFGDAIALDAVEVPAGRQPILRDILEEPVGDDLRKVRLSQKLWKYLKDYKKTQKAKGNGFGFGKPCLDGISRTLSARYGKDGSEILIDRGLGRLPRKLTVVEAARLMGFHEYVRERADVPVSDTQAYRQFGNALVPAVAKMVAEQALLCAISNVYTRPDHCLFKRNL